MDESPMYRLPEDALYQLFSRLPLHQIIICRSVCKFFNQFLTAPHFVDLISTQPSLYLLALRPPHNFQNHSSPSLHVFDLDQRHWFNLSLNFLPFPSPHPVASSHGLVYLWADSLDSSMPNKLLVVCNPLTRHFRVLPQLGSAWSRHGSVLVDSTNRVMVLTERAFLYVSGNSDNWLKFSSDLRSKPRSPVLVSDSVYALFDVGSPWRARLKLFKCNLGNLNTSQTWTRLEMPQWGDVFGIVKRPRLVRGVGNQILMVGALKAWFTLNSPCSTTVTIVILRLDLDSLEWDQLDRMPGDMFEFFQASRKFKVFGAGDKICFYAKDIGKLALWNYSEGKGEWRLIACDPGNGDGLCRGFLFEGNLTALP